jgi:hypothetical protein
MHPAPEQKPAAEDRDSDSDHEKPLAKKAKVSSGQKMRPVILGNLRTREDVPDIMRKMKKHKQNAGVQEERCRALIHDSGSVELE